MSKSIDRRILGLGITILVTLNGCRNTNPAFLGSVRMGMEGKTAVRESGGEVDTTTQTPDASTSLTRLETKSTSILDPEITTPAIEHTHTNSSTQSSEHRSSSQSQVNTTTATGYQVPRWNATEPAIDPNAGDTDFCKRGAKGCFLFSNPTQATLESETPGYDGIELILTGLTKPDSNTSNATSPLQHGVKLTGSSSRIESKHPFPRYKGQDFGIEIWYRSAPNPRYDNSKSVMIVQVLKDIWIEEDPVNGGLACAAPAEDSWSRKILHPVQIGPYARYPNFAPRDELRVVACVLSNKHLYLWNHNELIIHGPSQGGKTVRLPSDVTDQKMAIGSWVTGNDAGKNFQPLQGTVYMVRFWNNVDYMKKAMNSALSLHGINSDKLAKIPSP